MRTKTIFCVLFMLILSAAARAAGEERVFINGFTTDKGIENKKNTTDRIFKEEFLNADYRIADVSSIRAGLKMESLKMSVGSNNENTLKKIMASSDVEYTVYGYVRLKENYIFITAKMLDKSNDEIKLGRVKTIYMRKELADDFYNDGCRVLAAYLISNNSSKVQKFQDKMLAEERIYEINLRQNKLEGEENTETEKFRRKVVEYKQQRYDSIVNNKSWFRFGYNILEVTTDNDEFDHHFKPGYQFFIEWDIPFYNEGLVGIDFVSRYTCYYFRKKKDVNNNLSDEKLYRDFDQRGRTVFDAFDFGLRIRLGFYLLMTKFEIYGIGALGANERSFNAFYGGGVEIAFFPHVGFFVEYNRGTSSATGLHLDVDNNQQFFVGTTLRFSLK